MREWIEVLSELDELSEEIHQASLETDFLLQASDQLQTAYSSIVERVDHGSS